MTWIAGAIVIAALGLAFFPWFGRRPCPRCGSRRTTPHTGRATKLINVCRACGTVFDFNGTILP